MARYIERAENMARVLDVTYRMSLVSSGEHSEAELWKPPVLIADDVDVFERDYGEYTAANAVRYMALDEQNPSSIVSCLNTARENARSVRVAMSAEMWETVNALWLELRQRIAQGITEADIGEFCDWVKSRSHLFRGVTFGTMLRDAGYKFVRLGSFIERADNTARLLDAKYHLMMSSTEETVVDYYEWSYLLRSVSAFQAYQQVYRDTIEPSKVAELLVLRDDMPRSLHACYDEITSILEQVCVVRGKECLRIGGEIHASLHYGRMEHIFNDGLHDFLQYFIAHNNGLGIEIQRDFLNAPAN